MRVVIGEIRVHRLETQLLEDSSRIRPVVDVAYPRDISHEFRIPNEPRRLVRELAGLPGIIRRLAGDQDAGALVQELLRRVLQILRERQDGLLLAVVLGLARLVPGSGAVGASVVLAIEGTAVVVAKLDDHVVSFLNDLCDVVEAALARE